MSAAPGHALEVFGHGVVAHAFESLAACETHSSAARIVGAFARSNALIGAEPIDAIQWGVTSSRPHIAGATLRASGAWIFDAHIVRVETDQRDGSVLIAASVAVASAVLIPVGATGVVTRLTLAIVSGAARTGGAGRAARAGAVGSVGRYASCSRAIRVGRRSRWGAHVEDAIKTGIAVKHRGASSAVGFLRVILATDSENREEKGSE